MPNPFSNPTPLLIVVVTAEIERFVNVLNRSRFWSMVKLDVIYVVDTY